MIDLYAEDIGHYWKTSKTAPDTWLTRATRQIESAGGHILMEAFGRDADGRAAYMLQFELGSDVFKINWPALSSRSGNERAARIQAATMLYHDIKARCVSAKVLGARSAFFAYLSLPDGRTTAQASAPELMNGIPQMFKQTPQLVSGEIVGEEDAS